MTAAANASQRSRTSALGMGRAGPTFARHLSADQAGHRSGEEQVGAERQVSGKERSQPREIWKWFALAALLMLLLEWYIYNRRIYV